MRLALAYPRFVPDGGTGRYAHALARAVLAAGHELHVFCMEGVEPEPPPGARGVLELHRLPVPHLPLGATRAAFAAAVRARLRRGHFDASLALARVPGLGLYRAGGGCHAAYLRSLPPHRRASPRLRAELALERETLRRARLVVANAPQPAAELLAHYHIEPSRLRVVPNGVDGERFRPDPRARAELRAELGLSGGEPLVLFVGSDFERKGLDTALRAAARLGLGLWVLGGDRRRGPYRRLARRLGLRLRFLGARPDPERVLAAADALLHPTRYDSAANAVLEALSAGVPALTSGADGARAFLPEPWLCVEDPRDEAGFARALERALSEPGLGARCRSRAARYSWEASTEAMMGLLGELAGGAA